MDLTKVITKNAIEYQGRLDRNEWDEQLSDKYSLPSLTKEVIYTAKERLRSVRIILCCDIRRLH